MPAPLTEPMCSMCAHWVPGLADQSGIQKCAAFPAGIPDEIWDGLHDHREPLGDEKILFEPDEGVTEEDVEEWDRMVTANAADQILGQM